MASRGSRLTPIRAASYVIDRTFTYTREHAQCRNPFERIHQPYNREGQRTGALRFGDLRAMALAGALCCVVHAVSGFTNKSLRGLVAGLLGSD